MVDQAIFAGGGCPVTSLMLTAVIPAGEFELMRNRLLRAGDAGAIPHPRDLQLTYKLHMQKFNRI